MPITFHQVNADQLYEPAATLSERIRTRFPDTSLARIAAELVEIVRISAVRVQEIHAPPPVLSVLRYLSVSGAPSPRFGPDRVVA
jgi:hypothetical protein